MSSEKVPSTLPIAPLWASPFRPFCSLGVAYGVALRWASPTASR